MPLKVIGTGFGRTGTRSMQQALEMLGFGPCHHMFELNENPVMKSRWRAFVRKGGVPDWEALFEGYPSCMDWPSAHYWRELIDAYPDARVILTWRDPESWWKSFDKTIGTFMRKTDDHEGVGFKLIHDRLFGGRIDDRDLAIRLYEANVSAVKAAVPADRLLIHSLGDGWEPLCAHLGVPVPNQPYPRTNSTADMQDRISQP